VPDLHHGDSIPIEFLQDLEPPIPVRDKMTTFGKIARPAKIGLTLGPWLIRHREGVTRPLVDAFIQAVHDIPETGKLGVVGFCWGGRYAILAAQASDAGKGVDAAYACHPSLFALPGDFDPVKKPLSLAFGAKDSLIGQKEVESIRSLLAKKKDVPTEIKIYEDQIHGFSLRGDWSSEVDKKAMDDAVGQGVEWFGKYLE
jgi:dienelactone hydrolase